jgi:ribose 5-phosphate isomerase B
MKSTPLFIGADHAGFSLKEQVKVFLPNTVFIEDLSPVFTPGDDYPDVALKLAKKVAKHQGSRGILVCGSGVGVTIAANRIKGVRAFDAHSVEEVKLAREHNDANVISLSGWHEKPSQAKKLIQAFMEGKASKEARHVRRVKKLG